MLLLTLAALPSAAAERSTATVEAYQHVRQDDLRLLAPIAPSYLKDVTYTGGWNSNWFVEVKGGASAFLGSPIGCGDLFDRVMPALQVGIGKWLSPAIGGRISYQGLEFKNADLQEMSYQFIHADFMYNLTHGLNCDEYGVSKFDVIPYVGVGLIRNSSTPYGYFQAGGSPTKNYPFAFSYGIGVRYLLCDRLHLTGEVSGMTTVKNFDCVGTSGRFGDNMLSVSIGLSYTIGKRGWKKVVDARPYISQNDYLLDRYAALSQKNKEDDEQQTPIDKNDYSGLNALRYRISMDAAAGNPQDNMADTMDIRPGVPVYFYFRLNKAELVNETQLVNLEEIAEIAKEQNLMIHITGAADSATGSEKTNRRLSRERARFIAKQLIRLGVEKSMIQATCVGGIDEFSPKEANRFCVVLIAR